MTCFEKSRVWYVLFTNKLTELYYLYKLRLEKKEHSPEVTSSPSQNSYPSLKPEIDTHIHYPLWAISISRCIARYGMISFKISNRQIIAWRTVIIWILYDENVIERNHDECYKA